MTQPLSTEDLTRVIDCALDLAESGHWHTATLADIAHEAKIPVAALTSTVRTKLGVLSAFFRQVDAHAIANADPDTADISVRDRLFDLILCRFDAMDARKDALGRIMQDALNDPMDVLTGGALLGRSLAIMLEAAGVSTTGVGGLARIHGLGAIYLRTFQVWLTDQSPDMSVTMAELDKRLTQADQLLRWFEARRTRRQRPPSQQAFQQTDVASPTPESDTPEKATTLH